MLVVEHHHRDQASAILLVVHKLSPLVVPHVHSAHEAVCPIVPVKLALFVLEDHWNVDFAPMERRGDLVPVPRQQIENLLRLVEAGELNDLRQVAAEDLPVVLATFCPDCGGQPRCNRTASCTDFETVPTAQGA